MKLEDAGEKALLEMAIEICEKGPEVKVGIGDDAAVYEMDGELLVVTTDMLVEEVHFTSDITPDYLGEKAVVVNLSDLAAMGAEPQGLVYSFGAPKDEELEFVSDLLENINKTARSYDSYVLGGDMNEADEIIISGTAFGKVDEDELLLRSGAKPEDYIGVTGKLGAASAGVEIMLDKDYFLDDWQSLKKAVYEPKARVDEGRLLAQSGYVTSAIDVTDGLASDLWQISRMSETGLVVESSALPVSSETENFAIEAGKDLDEFLLYGGEDFELLFTAESDNWKELEKMFDGLETNITKIGKVTSDEGVFLNREGSLEKIPDKGYEHFKK